MTCVRSSCRVEVHMASSIGVPSMLGSFLTFHVLFRFISSQCTMHVEVGQCNRTEIPSLLPPTEANKRNREVSGDTPDPGRGASPPAPPLSKGKRKLLGAPQTRAGELRPLHPLLMREC